MNYYYIDELTEIKKENEYIIKSDFPPDINSIEKLTKYEKNAHIYDNFYIEFEKINNLTGQQIINICNNLDYNIVIKEFTDEQLFDIYSNYLTNDVSKSVYPAIIVVILTLYFLYDKIIMKFDNFTYFDEYISSIYDNITTDYLKSIFNKEQIISHTINFIVHISKNEKIVEDIVNNCWSINNCAENYILHGKYNKIDNNTYKSGFYIPISKIMNHRGYEKYINPPSKEYNIISHKDINYISELLYDNVSKSKMFDDYIFCENKETIELDNLNNLTPEGIINILLTKKKIITNDEKIEFDFFPLEIERKC